MVGGRPRPRRPRPGRADPPHRLPGLRPPARKPAADPRRHARAAPQPGHIRSRHPRGLHAKHTKLWVSDRDTELADGEDRRRARARGRRTAARGAADDRGSHRRNGQPRSMRAGLRRLDLGDRPRVHDQPGARATRRKQRHNPRRPSTPTSPERSSATRRCATGPGRDQPCRCGSGRKTKHCCGEHRDPSEARLARAHVAQLAHQTIHELDGLTDRPLDHLADEFMELPAIDLDRHAGTTGRLADAVVRLRDQNRIGRRQAAFALLTSTAKQPPPDPSVYPGK